MNGVSLYGTKFQSLSPFAGVKILIFTMLKLNKALACSAVQHHSSQAAHARNSGACCSDLCARLTRHTNT